MVTIFHISDLHIVKGDEIGSLADSMGRMEADIGEYIDSLEKIYLQYQFRYSQNV